MILKYLLIRLKQFYRIVNELGIFRIIFGFITITSVLLALLSSLFKNINYINFSILVFVFLFIVHSIRKDKNFIIIRKINYYKLYYGEYALLLLPLIIYLIIKTEFILIFLLLLIILLIPFFNFKIRNKKVKIKYSFLPYISYEWIGGLRVNFFYLIIIYIVAFFFFKFMYSIPIVIIIYSFTISSFYSEFESRQIIESYKLSPRRFLKYKIISNHFIFVISIFPLVILFLISHYAMWYLIIYLLVFCILIQTFNILYKYTLYDENKSISKNSYLNVILTIIYYIVFIIPLLLPILICLIYRYYKKSILNLNKYLYDYNK
jgi:hypothetical protein